MGLLQTNEPAGQTIGVIRENGQVETFSVVDGGGTQERLEIVVPAVAAGEVGYVTTDFVGDLATLATDSPILANPTADLVNAGAGGGFINARMSDTGSVRCAFVGPLAGGAVDFVFTAV
jgi:hypothetical protein